MTNITENTIRCLMQALEERIPAKEARKECGCVEKTSASEVLQFNNQAKN